MYSISLFNIADTRIKDQLLHFLLKGSYGILMMAYYLKLYTLHTSYVQTVH